MKKAIFRHFFDNFSRKASKHRFCSFSAFSFRFLPKIMPSEYPNRDNQTAFLFQSAYFSIAINGNPA